MSSSSAAKIAVIYYTTYGHVGTLAKSIVKGIQAAGAEAHVFQVPETLPKEVLEKMHAPAKDESVPVITDANKLAEFDGILFGMPTRFGGVPAQMKSFLDSTGGLWQKGGLVGKTAGTFFSTATQAGGQETTALTSLTTFVHHGMIYVPLGYVDPALFNMDEVHGGSPYGAGTLAGPTGARQPSALELGVAESHGKHFATITAALKKGRAQ